MLYISENFERPKPQARSSGYYETQFFSLVSFSKTPLRGCAKWYEKRSTLSWAVHGSHYSQGIILPCDISQFSPSIHQISITIFPSKEQRKRFLHLWKKSSGRFIKNQQKRITMIGPSDRILEKCGKSTVQNKWSLCALTLNWHCNQNRFFKKKKKSLKINPTPNFRELGKGRNIYLRHLQL